MKVLQLIDSLHAGGAERVAVNYANALSHGMGVSYLCATREEGILKNSLSQHVGYLFLKKQSALDVKAILRLYKFIGANNINIVHAHSTSYFLATIIKILKPKLVLIWHDHYGASEFLKKRPRLILRVCSSFFNHVITVNTKLEAWSKSVLKMKAVAYLPNFAVSKEGQPTTKLKGIEGKRVVCLANLRPQKDHITLLKAFKTVSKLYPDWTLHLVGKDFNDDHSKKIKAFINTEALQTHVFLYGSCPDIHHILSQSDIGVLSSKSEGLPLALLEYGLTGLPVVATHVGDCAHIITNTSEGQLVPPGNADALANALICYIDNKALRLQAGEHLKSRIMSTFSESAVMERLVDIYKQLLK